METSVTALADLAAGNLRAEMARRHLSIDDLAAALECSRPTARSRFNGDKALGLGELERVSLWLGVEWQVLLSAERAHA